MRINFSVCGYETGIALIMWQALNATIDVSRALDNGPICRGAPKQSPKVVNTRL